MEQAIKIAIENGYDIGVGIKYATNRDVYIADLKQSARAVICLDPLFWQCLGKGLGWGGNIDFVIDEHMEHESSLHIDKTVPVWHYQMYRFIDHLASGGDIESFFTNLR